MAVRIRLARAGAKGKPFYRVVAADSQYPRDGKFLEQLGTYDPRQSPPEIKLKHERVDYWLGVGAKPSETVRRFLKAASAGEAGAAEASA